MTIVEKHACSQSEYSRTLVKNKIVNVSAKEVWDDVAGAAFGDADQDNCINDAFEHGAVPGGASSYILVYTDVPLKYSKQPPFIY
jgi:hypothetical protein